MDTHIRLKGIRQNNLKGFDLNIELGSFTVVCGPSGSGKSSLAFETLYAEGQRRYIDSLSNYTKQFLNKAPKPDLEEIQNIPPAIALEQKNHIRNSRSTVGTSTEISDYLKVLFAKIGRPYCPNGHGRIESEDSTKALSKLLKENEGSRGYLLFKIDIVKCAIKEKDLLKNLIQDGFLRYISKLEDGVRPSTEDIGPKTKLPKDSFYIVVDRLAVARKDKGRIHDSIRTAYQGSLQYNHYLGGRAYFVDTDGHSIQFSEDLSCSICEASLPPISEALFSYSSPVGACDACNGFGNILDLDFKKIIPNPKLSIKKGAIYPFTMPSLAKYKTKLNAFCKEQGINTNTAWEELDQKTKDLILNGKGRYGGIYGSFDQMEEKKYKMHIRILLARFKSPSTCPSCNGSRLSTASQFVYIGGKNLRDLQKLSLGELQTFFSKLKLTKADKEIASEIFFQVRSRLKYLNEVGLHYLSLIRETKTLSGGEYQRIKLANQLGMELSQTLYVLDEPTIGLHPRDNHRLIHILKQLNEMGNTLVIVEHDREVIETASHIVEIGPKSGIYGGDLVYEGKSKDFHKCKNSPTLKYLVDDEDHKLCNLNFSKYKFIELSGCSGHNLKNVDLKIPLNAFSVITGVSGSGKSSLIQNTLYPAVAQKLEIDFVPSLDYEDIKGTDYLEDVVLVDQKAVGRSGRSNPSSYLGAYDEIRKLFAGTMMAKDRGLKPGYFSLNVEGGRCSTCSGDGFVVIDMQFMDDVVMECDDCKGSRFKEEALEIKYEGKSIKDVLSMTASEATEFFREITKIRRALAYLAEVGLDYLQLGQPANTLSGGESQRLKIAKELSRSRKGACLYVLDEPTTGLHFQEVELLVNTLKKLVSQGGSVVVIEHNLEFIRNAEYIVDVGPDGGDAGGEILFQGKAADLLKCKNSETAKFLR